MPDLKIISPKFSVTILGYYGNPAVGGHCYHQCQAKSVIENETFGYIGCATGEEDRECLWIIKSDKSDNTSLIQLTWDIKFANNDCKSTTNKVEVYDGLPGFISTPTSPMVSF